MLCIIIILPACNLQQEQVLTELMMYTTEDPVPFDAPLVKCTFKYLSACNLLFDLSHGKVTLNDKTILENMNKSLFL